MKKNDLQFHLGVSSEDIGKYVFLPGDPGRCKLIASFFDDAKRIAENREFTTYTGFLLGEKVSVVSTGIGGPSAAIALEELCKCGAHTYIRIGTCGDIQDEVRPGDIIIAQAAIRSEGLTREYVPLEYPAVANYEILNELLVAAKIENKRYHVGIVHSKDSFYGELEPESMPIANDLIYRWGVWKKCGAVASEMESAALFTVGGIRKVRVGSLFLAIDTKCPYDINDGIKVAVRAMKALIEKDKN